MNAVSYDICTMINNAGIATLGVNLFGIVWNTNYDDQILVVDTDGFETDLKDQYEQPGFQILVRGGKSESALAVHDRARSIYEYLIKQGKTEINSTCYLEFWPRHVPTPLGLDENDRFIYTINFYTYRNAIGA